MVQHTQSNHIINLINKREVNNHLINSIDAEKAFDKFQHPFLKKTLTKVGIEGIYLNIIKATYVKTTVNIILNAGKLKAFPLISGIRQRCSFSLILFNRVLEILTSSIRQTKEIKGIQCRREDIKL